MDETPAVWGEDGDGAAPLTDERRRGPEAKLDPPWAELTTYLLLSLQQVNTYNMSVETDPDLPALVHLLQRRRTDLPFVEAKAAGGGLPKSVRETLSAFSNDHGGQLLLGLDEANGFSPAAGFDAAKIRDDLASLCSDVMEPPVRADIQIEDFDGAQIIVATIPEKDPAANPAT